MSLKIKKHFAIIITKWLLLRAFAHTSRVNGDCSICWLYSPRKGLQLFFSIRIMVRFRASFRVCVMVSIKASVLVRVIKNKMDLPCKLLVTANMSLLLL